MKKKYTWLSLIILLFSFLLSPRQAFAHFPATDRSITTILHVDPNDDPIPGQNARLYFDIIDAAQKFTLTKCSCSVSITEGGKQLSLQTLGRKVDHGPSIVGASIPFVFPKRDVYQIALIGRPTARQAFQPFSLHWNFRVDEYPLSTEAPWSTAEYSLLAIGIGAALLGIGYAAALLVDSRKKRV